MDQQGIVPWTDWSEQAIGPNPYSCCVGKQSCIQLGEDNYASFLLDTVGYTSRVLRPAGTTAGYVSVIVPRKERNDILRDFAETLATTVTHHFWHAKAEEKVCSATEGTGYLSVDLTEKDARILIMNKRMFQTLGVAEDPDFFFKSLSEYIAPYPKNPEFWKILEKRSIVRDKTMEIVNSNGKTLTVCISTLDGKIDALQWDDFAILFHSITRIQKLASRHMGSAARYTFDTIIGNSYAFGIAKRQASNAAGSNANILLLGESGTGKDLLAQAIHNASPRKDAPFIAINCAAFSRELISSELFGYEEGAFTGAKKGGSIGKLEMAHGGTLFLDEIGDMPLDLQAVLLRVLEERCFMKIGGNKMVHVDVRVIAATNKNIEEKIAQGQFRADLFYRLGVVRVAVPPLRKRGDDILVLGEHFLRLFAREYSCGEMILTDEAKQMMLDYSWPGNVRELQNVMQEIAITHTDSMITGDMLAVRLKMEPEPQKTVMQQLNTDVSPSWSGQWKNDNNSDEKSRIKEALEQSRYNKSKAAELMGMSRSTFYRRLKELGME